MTTARATRYATATALTDVADAWKSRAIDGRATFTMVMSMMFMNIAATNTTLTATFWLKVAWRPEVMRRAKAAVRQAEPGGGRAAGSAAAAGTSPRIRRAPAHAIRRR